MPPARPRPRWSCPVGCPGSLGACVGLGLVVRGVGCLGFLPLGRVGWCFHVEASFLPGGAGPCASRPSGAPWVAAGCGGHARAGPTAGRCPRPGGRRSSPWPLPRPAEEPDCSSPRLRLARVPARVTQPRPHPRRGTLRCLPTPRCLPRPCRLLPASPFALPFVSPPPSVPSVVSALAGRVLPFCTPPPSVPVHFAHSLGPVYSDVQRRRTV